MNVKILAQLNFAGEFGIVYKGLIKKGFSDTISDSVAVKTLKGMK